MRQRMLLLAIVVASATSAASIGTAAAQGMTDGMGSGMMRGSMGQGMMRHGMDQQPNDRQPMRGDMGGMMCPMMRSGMMQGGMMGSDMMGMGKTAGGSDGLFGSRVTPMMNLSAEDVRGYLSSQLEHLNNKRLKLGDINSGDGTITADIVTVDNSLVQRLKVDRHSGAITYEN
ncbi:hypothetical protein ACVWXO_004366 [Bradyrhizobium sp. LM2.7]